MNTKSLFSTFRRDVPIMLSLMMGPPVLLWCIRLILKAHNVSQHCFGVIVECLGISISLAVFFILISRKKLGHGAIILMSVLFIISIILGTIDIYKNINELKMMIIPLLKIEVPIILLGASIMLLRPKK